MRYFSFYTNRTSQLNTVRNMNKYNVKLPKFSSFQRERKKSLVFNQITLFSFLTLSNLLRAFSYIALMTTQ
jgi:hypothetical protein